VVNSGRQWCRDRIRTCEFATLIQSSHLAALAPLPVTYS